jgi:hypothetical protein
LVLAIFCCKQLEETETGNRDEFPVLSDMEYKADSGLL